MKKWENADGTFKELPSIELEALTNEEADDYSVAKGLHLETKLSKLVEVKSAENMDAITELKDSIAENMKAQMGILKAQGEALSNMKVKNRNTGEIVSFSEAVAKSWEDSADKITQFKSGKLDGTGEIEVKTDVTTASVQGSTASMRIDGIGKAPVRRVFLESLFASARVGANSGGTITYWDQDTLTRNADNVAECGVIPESAINWQEYSCKVEKIADSIPVCSEALEDYEFIASEVQNFLLENVSLKCDQQILFGSGTTPQLKGIDATAQSWGAGNFALAIATPTIFDVIKTSKTQIEVSGENNSFMPDTVLMNPEDETLMKLSKDADGNYLLPMYMTSDGTMVDGLRIIVSPLVIQDTMYVFDSSKGQVYNHRALSLDLANQHASDFLTDTIRLRATVRKAFIIRNVNANAFVKVASISASITALTKP